MVALPVFEKKGEALSLPFFLSLGPLITVVILGIALLPTLIGCSVPVIAGNFREIDARVRGDLFIPDSAPAPKIVIVDAGMLPRLDSEVKDVLATSGGAVYDPNSQTIYLDASRYRDGILHHELVHHYSRYMTESQRIECLARLYEVHVSSNSSFAGCPR